MERSVPSLGGLRIGPEETTRTRSAASESQSEALRSTSIIGGSTLVVLLIRMVRTKILAVLLGPAGIGLEAVFDSVVSFARGLFDLGISNSGVRQIAAAVGSKDDRLIATTVFTLRRACLLLGITGAAALFLARELIARLVFGTTEHASALGWLAMALLFGAIAGGQGALIQGMRRIRDLASMNILGALAGMVLSVPIVYFWGQAGIPAYMIAGAAVSCLASWWFARRIRINAANATLPSMAREARGLLKLGLAFMSSGLLSTGALFAIRSVVSREAGIDAVGQFQAANALSMVYVGFILQAMGTDFYPRLTAISEDNPRCNRTVNEQAEISLLLALPGVLATLALAPWIIRIFYTGQFSEAATILSWQVAGMLLRVVSWPMGFIMLAKGRGATFVWTDAMAYAVYVGLAWGGLRLFGLPGIGMAFLGLYIFHSLLVYVVVRRLSGFRWSTKNLRMISVAIVATALALCARLFLSDPWATAVGSILSLAAAAYCFNGLVQIIGMTEILRYLNKFGARRLLAFGK